jgi:hypothetical protein
MGRAKSDHGGDERTFKTEGDRPKPLSTDRVARAVGFVGSITWRGVSDFVFANLPDRGRHDRLQKD